MNVLAELRSRFAAALATMAPEADVPALVDMIRPTQDAKFGDYQANCAMPLGKRLGRNPRDVATEIVSRLQVAELCDPPTLAGPGFINLRLRDDWLVGHLAAAVNDERLGVPLAERPRTYVVDYSAPNVAKPMHVGHIRSTVIGDALYRVLKFLGHHAVGDNHLGDWGTQFGMILSGYKQFLDADAYRRSPVDELASLYRKVNQLADEQPAVAEQALQETVKLHAGDPENLRLWQEFMPPCLEAIDRIYQRLSVTFDVALGESFYHPRLGEVVDSLTACGLARESDGALCVFLDGYETPMIVRKRDGAFLYATTDLATIKYRMETWKPDAILYVVDHRQSLHFEQLFATAKLWGYGDVELKHVSFGTVLGEDGRPFKTRSGDTVGLTGLLDEAVARAHRIVSENDDAKPGGAELSAAERHRIAETVGIAALKYADLSQNRTSDYTFSYDKMLAMNGNTATYMQYAYARVQSIFRRGGVDVAALRAAGKPIALVDPAEQALARRLLRFSEALDAMVVDYRPHQLTTYLFELAEGYSTFFERCPVLKADTPATRDSRLLLCDLTARTIRKGLELLGIAVVEQM
ncbi:MAG TPA: arginine--tRNA ligase [Pirellulales bacterium]|jgi:arginyl-tRNA synthetase|nr:arginine--tRNA ligase [Pirellulales bacterium]